MNGVKALIAGLVQNPDLVKDLIKDPQSFARLAGLGEAELGSLKEVTKFASGLLNRLSGPSLCATAAPLVVAASAVAAGSRDTRPIGGQGVALAGMVSLAAIAGAALVVGTVSLVAIARGNGKQTP